MLMTYQKRGMVENLNNKAVYIQDLLLDKIILPLVALAHLQTTQWRVGAVAAHAYYNEKV